ncbi:MAG: PTS transporter subunit EIIC [Clostridium sp.]|nr:PTS transporter subunit EIIC [Clostridium sp.]
MKSKGKVWQSVQTFGRSLLLPVALMAPIGMVMGICNALTQSYMIEQFGWLSNGTLQIILKSLKSITSVIFDNIPLLFAMGVAYGLSKKEKGIAVFSSVVAYLTLNIVMNVYLTVTGTLASPETMSQLGQGVVLGVQTLRIDALGGIISGILAAKCADRFYKLQLPLAFAFFSGKKSVPIISFAVMIPIGLVIPFFWAIITKILISSSVILMNKYVGPGVYMTLNRMLIPFGLHHVLSSIVRFTEAGGVYMIDGEQYIGVMNALNQILFNLGPTHEAWNALMPTLSSYMAPAQMLTTLFRIPAIGLAMYHTAFTKNKKVAKGVIITVCLTAFLGNITEPLEFTLLLVSPILFFTYAILAGVMTIPMSFLGIKMGYIRGTIFDFGIFGLLYENTNWINLVLLGIVNFVVFYFVFKFMIKKFNFVTPGREDFELNEDASHLLKEKRYKEISEIVIEGLGGKANILSVENCVSRLRVDVENPNLINQDKLRESGCLGIFLPSEKHIHVVFGPHVEFVKHAVDDTIKQLA